MIISHSDTNRSNRKSEAGHPRGFTLIELLVVISIIALLIAILLPALGAARRQAQSLQCKTNMRSIATAYYYYAHDNDDELYHMGQTDTVVTQYGGSGNYDNNAWHTALYQYLNGDNELFWCPAVAIDTVVLFDAYPKLRRTYVGNGMIHDQQSLDGDPPGSGGLIKLNSVRFGMIGRPDHLFVIADGIGAGDAWSKDIHGNFDYLDGTYPLRCKIRIVHPHHANAGFVDGHVAVLPDTGPGLLGDRIDPRDNN